MFKEKGIDGLEATREWLSRAYKRISDEKTIGSFKYESGATPSAICNEAFMEIFVWTNENLFPEVWFYAFESIFIFIFFFLEFNIFLML